MITKADLASSIAQVKGCPKGTAEGWVDDVVDAIAERVTNGEDLDLRGLGIFKRERVEARQGHNPRTGEAIQIEAGYRVKFKPGKRLRDRLPAA